MTRAAALVMSLLTVSLPALAQTAVAPRDVTLTAGDGTSLKATYYAAAKPGPAVLLLHMCNTTRKSWEPLAPQLAAAGIHTLLFPEGVLNLLGYQHLQQHRTKEAIELFKLNTEAYPASANTYDSLGDAYLADGQSDLALQASQKAIDLLPNDPAPDEFKKAIRASAEQKIARLKGRLRLNRSTSRSASRTAPHRP